MDTTTAVDRVETARSWAGVVVVVAGDAAIVVASVFMVLKVATGPDVTQVVAVLTSAFTAVGTMTTAFFGIRAASNTAQSVVSGTGETSVSRRSPVRPEPVVTGIEPAQAPATGGATLMVTGEGFAPDASVKVGDVTAMCRVDSGDRITVTCPPGTAGVANLTVKTSGGLSVTSEASKFTYV